MLNILPFIIFGGSNMAGNCEDLSQEYNLVKHMSFVVEKEPITAKFLISILNELEQKYPGIPIEIRNFASKTKHVGITVVEHKVTKKLCAFM